MGTFDEADMRILGEQITGIMEPVKDNGGAYFNNFRFGDVVMNYACNVQNLSYINFSIVLSDFRDLSGNFRKDFPIDVHRDDAFDKNPMTFIKHSIQSTINDFGRFVHDWGDMDGLKADLENAKENGWPQEKDMTPNQLARYNHLQALWRKATSRRIDSTRREIRDFSPDQVMRDILDLKGMVPLYNKARSTGAHQGTVVDWKDIYAETERKKIVICPISSTGLGHAMTAIFFENEMYFADPDGDLVEKGDDLNAVTQPMLDEAANMGKDLKESLVTKAAHRKNILELIKRKYEKSTGATLNVRVKHILEVNNCLKDSIVKSKIEAVPGVTKTYPYLTICFTHYLIITFAMHRLCCQAQKCPSQPRALVDLFYEKYEGYNEHQSDELVNEFVEASKRAVASHEFKSRFKLGALGLTAAGAAGALGVRKLSRSLNRNRKNKSRRRSRRSRR
ncbi:MAG: hypothetical protein CMB64_03150 [Euryarchaeota archaeon]|nr:hypothetical protein [Euryarchaeota archaeon]